MDDWSAMLQTQPHPQRKKRETRRRRFRTRPVGDQSAPVNQSRTMRRRFKSSEPSQSVPIGGGRGGTQWRLGAIQRRNQVATSTSTSPPALKEGKRSMWNSARRQEVKHPVQRDPLHSVLTTSTTTARSIQQQPEQSPPPPQVSRDYMSVLMEIVSQTSSLTLDVLNVYKTRDPVNDPRPKCLERLLCQLNQDWRSKGAAPAAMAPFLRFILILIDQNHPIDQVQYSPIKSERRLVYFLVD